MEASGFWWYRVRTPNNNKLLLIQVWAGSKLKTWGGQIYISPGLAWTYGGLNHPAIGIPPINGNPHMCVYVYYIYICNIHIYIPSFTSHQLVDLPSNSTWAEVFLKRWSSWRWVLRVAPRVLQRSATARARPGVRKGGTSVIGILDIYI